VGRRGDGLGGVDFDATCVGTLEVSA